MGFDKGLLGKDSKGFIGLLQRSLNCCNGFLVLYTLRDYKGVSSQFRPHQYATATTRHMARIATMLLLVQLMMTEGTVPVLQGATHAVVGVVASAVVVAVEVALVAACDRGRDCDGQDNGE